MYSYKPGQFHPSLNMVKLEWFRCHSVFGVIPYEQNKSLADELEQRASNEWQAFHDDQRDQASEKYTSELVNWFAEKFEPMMYFSGAYEAKEEQFVKSKGLSSQFAGQWQPGYMDIITNVNVHELALISKDAWLVCFETWDQVFMHIDKRLVPQKFLQPLKP